MLAQQNKNEKINQIAIVSSNLNTRIHSPSKLTILGLQKADSLKKNEWMCANLDSYCYENVNE